MPYVVITSKFPLNKANEAAKIYVENIKEFRSAQRALTKEIIPNAVKATDDGIESFGVHDVKEGKLEEFLLLQQKEMVKYHEVEGYKYTIEVRFKATEALEMIGLKIPE